MVTDYVMIPRALIEREERVSYQSPDFKPEDHILNNGTLWGIIHSAVISEINEVAGQKKSQVDWDSEHDGFVKVKGELDVNGMASLIEFYVRAFLRDRAVIAAFR